MNKACEDYWNLFWKDNKHPVSVSAWQFGVDPDQLADLVAKGIKTATCSAYVFYEREHEELPKVGDYNIILTSQDKPVCITKTIEVAIIPMNQVSEQHAREEGEGDRTHDYWWKVHQDSFTKELSSIGQPFKVDMLLVCERFTLVDIK
ncbi:ASCH domain-containing protein [Sporolactobacillus nakayamae]|uniref:Uncharacterized protein YhfF n=1 Tax=Sporolactobacillus nakayamae TaxID=269670 RepID=A0A1I2N2G4_9BACL|nr:ASCH domain-containing protein [Sporolactobacillus nakayamae]SFF98075.1 Uncharacterized protein YhfF [Sporolactobacillus nakayamae]